MISNGFVLHRDGNLIIHHIAEADVQSTEDLRYAWRFHPSAFDQPHCFGRGHNLPCRHGYRHSDPVVAIFVLVSLVGLIYPPSLNRKCGFAMVSRGLLPCFRTAFPQTNP